MKIAVFQINDCDGAVHLMCVPMPSLQAACTLETWVRMYTGPERSIQLLGRFDSVHTVLSEEEAEVFMLSDDKAGRENVVLEKLTS